MACLLSRFVIDLQSFSIYGRETDSHQRPLLVSSQSSSPISQMHSELELSPVDKRSDYRFNLLIQPLQIAYDAVGRGNRDRTWSKVFSLQPTINQIVSHFDPNDENLATISIPFVILFTRWWGLNGSPLPSIKHRTLAEMEDDLTQEKVFDLTIQLNGISLLLPGKGVLHESVDISLDWLLYPGVFSSASMVHVDFDRLLFRACPDVDHHHGLSQVCSRRDRWVLIVVHHLRKSSKLDGSIQNINCNGTIYPCPIPSQVYFVSLQRVNPRWSLYYSDRTRCHLCRRIPLLEMTFFKCIYSDDQCLLEWVIRCWDFSLERPSSWRFGSLGGKERWNWTLQHSHDKTDSSSAIDPFALRQHDGDLASNQSLLCVTDETDLHSSSILFSHDLSPPNEYSIRSLDSTLSSPSPPTANRHTHRSRSIFLCPSIERFFSPR